eukprot:gene487-1132_t
MLPATGISFVVIFWCLIFLADRILSGKRFAARYRRLLEKVGITVSFLQIKSYTRHFNKYFYSVGKMPGNLVLLWYNLGVVFGCVAMISSVGILAMMLYKNFAEEKPEQILTPVIPGVNIPFRHIIYYFLTLAIGGTLHEAGHAIAAARENVRVLGFGWFVLPIFCGAYVELQTDHLQVIPALRQLRIYCAGVWHNFVSASLAVGCCWAFPYVYLLLYHTNKGAVVSDVFRGSSVYDSLRRGDQITAVNDCRVSSVQDYALCIQKAAEMTNRGYCHGVNSLERRNTSMPYLSQNGSEPECCSGNSPSRFCFSHEISHQMTHSCLPARFISTNKAQCYDNADCIGKTEGIKPSICVVPLTSTANRFIKISRVKGEDILFVGNPYELVFHVSLSDYFSKWSFIPLDIPDYIQTFLLYPSQ